MTTQLNPISLPLAQNNVIEASAGTGKTYTMVTLYLRLLLQAGENNFPMPLDIEQILVVTFTRDATKELRQRINQRIQSWLKLLQQYQQHQDKQQIDDAELLALLPYLENNLDLAIQRLTFATQYIDKAAIFTIHSFCQRILRQYAFDSGLTFNFSVSEANQQQLRQINYQLWREQFYSLSATQAQIVTDIFQSPDTFFDANEALLSGEMPKITTALPFTDLQAGLSYYQQQLDEFTAIEQRYFAEFTQWFNQYRDNVQKRSNEKIIAYCQSVTEDSDIKQRMQQAITLTEIKFYKGKEVQLPELVFKLEQFFEQFSYTAYVSVMNYLYLTTLRERIFAYQDQHNEKYFDDLLRVLRDVLLKPQAEKLIRLIRQQYPFAMIDEFQDTDPVQLTIFEKIYLSPISDQQVTGFTVIGDPKQAIYRFRGADVFTYLSIMDQQQNNHIEHIYTLQHNYRSSVALIDSINQLFSQTQNPFYLTNIQFPLISAHRQGYLAIAQKRQKPWQILQLNEEIKYKESYQLAMAEAFACHIQQLLKAAEQQQALFIEDPESQQQVVAAKDIAVLVRNRDESQIIRNVLAKKGITAVFLSEQANVFETTTARDLALILQACFTPFSERAVLSALGSTLWGLTAAQIYQLKEDESQWAALIDRLLNYRHIWQTQGVLPMLYRLYQTEEIPQRLQQFELGERYLVDLLHLSELLQQAMNQQQNEEALLNWYQQQLSGVQGNEENRLRLEREQNVVKIITIHKSKGLEFPIVCLPFILTKKVAGKAEFYHNQQNQLMWDMLKEHTEQTRLENNAEDMRLLYVALTRAKYQLVVGVPAEPMFNEKSNLATLNPLDYLLLQGEKADFSAHNHYAELFDRALSPEHWQVTMTNKLPYNDNWRPNLANTPTLTVRQFSQDIEKNWLVTSFSALQAKLQELYTQHFADIGQDHFDQDLSSNWHNDSEVTITDTELSHYYPTGFSPFDFPKGAVVGSCLHSYLEKLDFTQPISIDSLTTICQALNLEETWLSPLQLWFTQILQQPLPELGCLNQISKRDKLTELQFYLKLGKLFNNQEFNSVLSQYHPLYDQHYPIRVDEIKGFIRGFIDAVVRRDNHYYIIDYKSNFLGEQLSCYQEENLRKVISAQRYDLQYLIYTLAVHRYLKLNDPEYQYETHFGGVFYLFLRGMAVPDTQQHTGIFFTKPATVLIEKLDQLWGE
ncbi:exodeoxyribonuclease V subunit beta [Gallibacterium salpingitidis]|uniref:RecBCD enzyme subunit RecB n=1 Tax=Gallibacterium salpingitidis TaxID=505341 RepID=A0A1A7NTD2_9PAST|nr:exodeoxyribonuclease V subunit beta [Gallibacterium salpingitidis]OBW92913.1 exonuclease V subunit beta [Gallibacterium salpingitidis]